MQIKCSILVMKAQLFVISTSALFLPGKFSESKLYLEVWVWPIRHMIMKRGCLYLHRILQQMEDSMLFKFFITQLKDPKHGDWAS